jgi:hypothetical protein
MLSGSENNRKGLAATHRDASEKDAGGEGGFEFFGVIENM